MNPEHEPQNRRGLLVSALAGAAALPLAGHALKQALEGREFKQFEFSKALLAQGEPDLSTVNLNHKIQSWNAALADLDRSYHSAYWRSETVPEPYLDSDGKLQMRLTTRYFWDEEPGVPHHGTVDSWLSHSTKLADKAKELLDPQLVDPSKIDQVTIVNRETNGTVQSVLRIGIFGSAIAALSRYDKLLGLDNAEYSQPQDEPQSTQVRRSFIKSLASLAGLAAASTAASRVSEGIARGETHLNEEKSKAKSEARAGHAVCYQTLLNETLSETYNRVNEQIKVLKLTLESGVTDSEVKRSMHAVLGHSQQLAAELKEYKDKGLPSELGRRLAAKVVTDRLQDAARSDRNLANAGVLLEGLAAGAAIAATLIPLEIINSKIGD